MRVDTVPRSQPRSSNMAERIPNATQSERPRCLLTHPRAFPRLLRRHLFSPHCHVRQRALGDVRGPRVHGSTRYFDPLLDSPAVP